MTRKEEDITELRYVVAIK